LNTDLILSENSAHDSSVLSISSNDRQFCTFYIGHRRFGINIKEMQEVSIIPNITPLYHVPFYVTGLVNIRSQIFLCLDFRQIFGLEKTELTEESRLVLFKYSVNESFGIIVDEVDDIIEVNESLIEEFDHTSVDDSVDKLTPKSKKLIKHIGRLKDELLLIIDPAVLLSELEFDMEHKYNN
jgi:purine-binding chemotaxis protein CheW